MQEFAEDDIFLAEFSLRPGEAWDWTIQQAVFHAHVMVVLIGRHWLSQRDGKRRIDSPDDIVRREIVGALDCGIHIVPLLLPEAGIPGADEFGSDDDLSVLPLLQFHRLGGARHWKNDVKEIVAILRQYLRQAKDARRDERTDSTHAAPQKKAGDPADRSL